jgi:hypothetical protein
MKTLLALAGAVTLCGCAFNRQYAHTTSTNPTNGVVSVTVAKSTTVALGDAKAAIDKTRASAGATSSVGASGISEQTTSTNALDFVGTVVGAAVHAAVKP